MSRPPYWLERSQSFFPQSWSRQKRMIRSGAPSSLPRLLQRLRPKLSRLLTKPPIQFPINVVSFCHGFIKAPFLVTIDLTNLHFTWEAEGCPPWRKCDRYGRFG